MTSLSQNLAKCQGGDLELLEIGCSTPPWDCLFVTNNLTTELTENLKQKAYQSTSLKYFISIDYNMVNSI